MIGRNPYRELEKNLGYRFRRRGWIEQALTHPSYAHEQSPEIPDNQRLEFLGDAALGLVAAAALYALNPDADEGELTKVRSLLSNTKALAQFARGIELGTHLRLGHGEEVTGGRERPSILADALEAVIGAAYMDGGLKAVEKLFARVFSAHLAAFGSAAQRDNPKGELQEYAQRTNGATPRYHVIHEEGPPHHKTFTVDVYVGTTQLGSGTGHTKREAETQAALHALRTLPPS